MNSGMQNKEEDLLTDIIQQLSAVKRKKLLPWWIKAFAWLFLAFGAFAFFGIVCSLFGYNYQISLYGLDTKEPLSLIGVSVILLFLIKGVTAYGLLMETDWAITIGLIDAITGIVICCLLMIYALSPSAHMKFTFRLELLLLIPYLIRLRKIKSAWENTMNK